jgi:hypothetical protein
MPLFLMKNLIFNKFAFFTLYFYLLGNTGKGQEAQLPDPYIFQAEKGLVYDASLQYNHQHVSGLLVMKNEAAGYHIMLLSKFGFTIMDFVMDEEGIVWNKMIPWLEKKMIQKAIEKDFRVLLLSPLDAPKKIKHKKKNIFTIKKKIKVAVQVGEDQEQIQWAKSKGFINLFKSQAVYYYTNEDDIPDEICLFHPHVKMKIEMNLMNR